MANKASDSKVSYVKVLRGDVKMATMNDCELCDGHLENQELKEENRKLKIHIKYLVHEFVDDKQVFIKELSPSENLRQLVAEYTESTKRCKQLEELFDKLDAIVNKHE